MGSIKNTSMLLQFTVIVLMSGAASYAFQRTVTVYQINGICFFRYLAYALAVVLGYVCFSHYRKSIALAFSLALSIVAFTPIGLSAIELFPLMIPFLVVMMGVTSIMISPSSGGRGFFEFLVVLILPAVLAESRIGGSSRLLATAESIGYLELSVATVCVVGGYFFLRYAAMVNLSRLELLSKGGNEQDIVEVGKWCNAIMILVVIGASGIAASLMAAGPIVADVLRATVVASPHNVLALAMGAGFIIVATIFYLFQLHQKENH